MHGTKGTSQHANGEPSEPRKGRVIDMRAWKTKRRIDQMRTPQWRLLALFWLTAGLAAAACVFAVAAWLPFPGQADSILLSWFFAVIGAAFGSVLYAMHHRLARQLLLIDVSCMAVALVAALVVFRLLSH